MRKLDVLKEENETLRRENQRLREELAETTAAWSALRGVVYSPAGALPDVATELKRARSKFAPFHSGHEGFAVLKEEVDELWQELCWGKGPEHPARLRAEAVQVAAMAVRFIEDVCDKQAPIVPATSSELSLSEVP